MSLFPKTAGAVILLPSVGGNCATRAGNGGSILAQSLHARCAEGPRRYQYCINYLLAKELAYNVLSDQTDKLAASLAKVSGNDIVAFAQALKVSDPGIDAKLCRAGSGSARNTSNYAKCTDTSNGNNKHGLSEFVNASLEGGAKNWPKATQASNHDNAKDVATGLVGLPKDEKSIVVGHLAKSIEGGEVVERIATKYSALRRVVVCYQSEYCIKNAFAQALKVSDASFDNKICYNHGTDYDGASHKVCNSSGSHGSNTSMTQFFEKGLKGGTANWPTGTSTNDNAIAVAKDIIKLTKDEKSVVAGHLAKSIEGGEVVERIATKYGALRHVVVCYQCRILHKERFRSGS